ncbi:MAG TPA: NADH-quinone oxidoreductase subunit M [Aggregatilineales bacterium]|nr:NADH-quinone oxidoreductase subunit M [Aggregatilineales bacterium]
MLLTATLAILIIAALIILFAYRDDQKNEVRLLAILATGLALLASLLEFALMNTDANIAAAQAAAALGHSYFIDEIRLAWIPSLGIAYHVGVDGTTAPMVLLTGLAGFCGVLISWRITDRTREFLAMFLLLVVGVYGVFVSLDLFLLFFWYELAIFPMYLLIATWGWPVTREYAAMKLTLYILGGSVIALVGVLVMYFAAGSFFSQGTRLQTLKTYLQKSYPSIAGSFSDHTAFSFDFTHFDAATHWQQISGNPDYAPSGTQPEPGPFDLASFGGISIAKFWFPFIFIGFGVLAGLFPFHNWSPDGHVAAPTAVSMIHAGVLMKLGAYAALRVGAQLLPEGAKIHLPWLIGLTLINVVYGAFIAFRQRDFKYVIGFSSVSHMGLVSMGFASMNNYGLTGAGLQMFSHGAMTALFFACVGMVYDQAHTRDVPSLGGFAQKMPLVAVAFIIGGLASMGMPGLSGFIAEFTIFSGVWHGPSFSAAAVNFPMAPNFNYYTLIVIVAALGIIVTAAYVLRVVQQVFFGGEFNDKRFPGVTDVSFQDKAALALLVSNLVIVGVYPRIMSTMIQAGMSPIVKALGG